MLSFGEQGATTTTTTLQAITTSSLASNVLKSIIENPLTFEKAINNVSTGLNNGRYPPLNKPFLLNRNIVNGIQNGNGLHHRKTSSGENVLEESDDDSDRHVNGEKPSAKGEEKISTEWSRILQRPPGLRNFANTCYMNSTLQALMHIPPLVAYLLDETHGLKCIVSQPQP